MSAESLLELTDDNFAKHTSSGVALVDFWAPWCGPCRSQAPVMDDLAEDMAGQAVIAKVNVDENSATAAQFGIRGIPTILIFKNGEVVARMVGVQTRQNLLTALREHLGT